MTVRLILIAHGSTVAVTRAAFPLDEPLDAHGMAKAEAAGAALGKFERAWCAPSRRTVETATALRLKAKVEPDLRDCDFGRWAGRSFDEVEAAEPEAVAAWTTDPAAAPHGGESVLDLLERVAAWLDTQSSAKGRVASVTHASVVRAAIVRVIGGAPETFWQLDVGPLSRTTLVHGGKHWLLESSNVRL